MAQFSFFDSDNFNFNFNFNFGGASFHGTPTEEPGRSTKQVRVDATEEIAFEDDYTVRTMAGRDHIRDKRILVKVIASFTFNDILIRRKVWTAEYSSGIMYDDKMVVRTIMDQFKQVKVEVFNPRIPPTLITDGVQTVMTDKAFELFKKLSPV